MPRGIPRLNNRPAADLPEEGLKPQSAAPIMEAALSPRAAEVRRERRRREDGDMDRMARFNLAISPELEERAKREGKVLRWMIDQPGRIAAAKADDWDAVDGVAHVAAGPDTSEKLVLMEKYKDWHEGDQAQDQQVIADREKAMVAGGSSDNRRGEDGLIVPANHRNRVSHDRG